MLYSYGGIKFTDPIGKVLFFVDYDSLDPIKKQFALYADKFDPFALESNAMSQYLGKRIESYPKKTVTNCCASVWVALEAEGFGANLQHYSPLIDTKVQENWNVPASWKLDAQLVFGVPASKDLPEKTFQPLEDRLKVFGK